MKKFLIAAVFTLVSVGGFAFAPAGIDDSVIASFKTHFPNAQQIVWHEFTDSYEVFFVDDNVQQRITYQKDQSLIRMIRYFDEKNLPFDIAFILSKEMPGKKIYGVREISTISEPNSQLLREYDLTLYDNDKWYIVKMDSEGNYHVEKKFKRA